MAIFQFFFKMAAVRHLGFVMCVFGPQTKGIWWSLSLCKIWLEVLIMCVFFDFSSLAGKRLFTPPKLGFLGGRDPLNGETHQRGPQKAHPWAERRHMTYRSSKSVHRCDLCAWRRERKKTKKETYHWQTGYSPRPPVLWDRNEILRGGWSSGGSSKFRISSKSVKRFRSCGGRNLPIPIDLAIGLYNSLYYCTSRDNLSMHFASQMPFLLPNLQFQSFRRSSKQWR